MGITRPTGEQLRFRSQFTGDHVLDTYLEASEKGNRQLSDLLDDLFDSSGVFRAANFEFRFDEATDKIQFRVGNFANSTTGWTDLTTFFKITGTFNSSTTYNNFDLITLSTKDIYIVHGLSSGTTFADEAAVIASSNTDKLVDVSEARDWAKKTDGIVSSTDYSAKAWAIGGTGVTNSATGGAAKEWATKTSGTVDGTNFSAKYWATHTDVVNVSTNIASVTSVASAISNVNTVSTNISNVNTTASSIANVNTVAAELGAGQDVTVVAASITNVGTVASDISNVNTAAGSIANVNTVAGSITNVNTVGGSIANVNTTATNIADVNTVATEINNNNLQTVAADIQAVIDVANDLNEATSEIDVVANNIANVNTVGTNISNVNTVAGISADVTTAATNVVAFNNTYLGAQSSAPTLDPDGSALDVGDLYFDTTSNTMKVYSSSGWTNAGSSVNGTAERQEYIATSGQTNFSATYDVGFVDVYLNGIKLVPTTDFTATDGATVILTTGAVAGNNISIIAYGAFNVADVYTQAQSDARYAQIANVYNKTDSDARYTQKSNNLSDLDSAATALTNLGLTATAAELNTLDGITATTTELNYVDGVTSNIQTQIDNIDALPSQTGNNGLFLTTDGSTASWAEAGGGAWTFINSTTVSGAVSSIDITSGIDSTYDMYVLQLVKIAPVNTGSGNTFRMATSSDGGSTFDATGYSYSAGSVTDAITSFGFQSSASNTYIRLTDTGSGATSGESLSGFIYLVKPSDAANFYCFWDLAGLGYPSSQFQRHIGGAQRETAADVNAIRIYHANNIDGGTIRLYGIKNS